VDAELSQRADVARPGEWVSESGKLYTVAQAAERLNTSVRFVRRLIADRRIAFVRLGRHVRLAEEDIAAFIDAGRVKPINREEIRSTWWRAS
jgi:excisionase family DNA binding protein